MISPLLSQLLVAGSTYLAELSAGGEVAYPSVMLQQLKANDTTIPLDLRSSSWIGSVHGFGGIPSILMPLFMQYKGRKIAFMISCILIIIGWVLIYAAQDVTTLLIGECFHGVGGNCLLSVSLLNIAEVIQPKYRNTCLSLCAASQKLGVTSVGILGQYLHWKTVGLIMCCPVFLALPIGCIWPESPSWLAWKGRLEECQKSFEQIRGTDEESRNELKALIESQHESKTEQSVMQWLRDLRTKVVQRDFYMPCFHTMVLLNLVYWGGGLSMIIYSNDMFIKASGKGNDKVKLFMNIIYFVGFCTVSFIIRYWSSKKFLLLSLIGSGIFMTAASVITYMQSIGILPKDSELAVYSLAASFLFNSLGSGSLGFCIASELMPVKHRGLGGSLFVICTCIYHSTSLKAYPYLCLYVNIWGTFLIYGLYTLMSAIFIWRYVPETKNRTLQEIEQFYANGYFEEADKDVSVHVPFIKANSNLK